MLASDRASRGRRFKTIQEQYGEDNETFAVRLNARALELGLSGGWNAPRVSKVRTGIQDLSPDDVTVLASIDQEHRGFTWVAHGVAVKKGEDAWAVLARVAKQAKRA